VPGEIIPPEMLVLDLIYKRTTFLREAEAAGSTVSDGELMLLHQGAAAFTLWTGKPAPLELMQRKLHEAREGGLRSAEGEPAGDAVAGAGTAGAGTAPAGGEVAGAGTAAAGAEAAVGDPGTDATNGSGGESGAGEPTGAARPD
jgi:hypothetical protein